MTAPAGHERGLPDGIEPGHLQALIGALEAERDFSLFAVALAVILVHLLYAALFAASLPPVEAAGWLLAGSAAIVVALRLYPPAGALGRLTLVAVFGLPALIVGIGIHVVHGVALARGSRTSRASGSRSPVARSSCSVLRRPSGC